MNIHATYKRVKINWWVFILFGGLYVLMIFAYIHQWGDKPIDKSGLIHISIIFLFVCLFIGRFKVIINDKYAIFRSDIWIPVKIPISMIEGVSVKKGLPIMDVCIPGISKTMKYQFDFSASHTVKIQKKSGKTYQISIENAQKIKKEIEKRMITTNNNKTSVA